MPAGETWRVFGLGSMVTAQPSGKRILAQLASGKCQHRADCIGLVERDGDIVQLQEKARQHPCSAFVAICEGMVACDAIGISRRQNERVAFAISQLVQRPGNRGFEQPIILDADQPTVLGKLPIMDRPRHGRVKKASVGHTLSARKNGENVPILAHNVFCGSHRFGEIGIMCGERIAARRIGQKQLVPLPHAKAREHLFGQDDTGRIANLDKLQRLVHTDVITVLRVTFKSAAAIRFRKEGMEQDRRI